MRNVILFVLICGLGRVLTKSPPLWPDQFDAAFDVLVPKYVSYLDGRSWDLMSSQTLRREQSSYKKDTYITTGRCARCGLITMTGAFLSSARNVLREDYTTRLVHSWWLRQALTLSVPTSQSQRIGAACSKQVSQCLHLIGSLTRSTMGLQLYEISCATSGGSLAQVSPRHYMTRGTQIELYL